MYIKSHAYTHARLAAHRRKMPPTQFRAHFDKGVLPIKLEPLESGWCNRPHLSITITLSHHDPPVSLAIIIATTITVPSPPSSPMMQEKA